MLPKFVGAPDTPTFNVLFLMLTMDILYIHNSLPFAIRKAKAAARVKKDTPQISEFSTAT